MAQEKIAERIFDSVVKTYDRFLNFTTFGLINKWQNIMVKNTPAGKFSVDIGTGTGEVIKKIQDEYPETIAIGIDVSFNMLKKAKEKNEGKKNSFIKASAYNLPLKKESIDSILMSLVFRHLEQEKAIKEFDRVLKNGGYLSILDISKPKIDFIFKSIFFFANKIFRPLGEKIFSKEEYDYFMESVLNSKKPDELKNFLKKSGFEVVFLSTYFGGMVVIGIFRKQI